MATDILGLPTLAAAQAQKHVTMNEALIALDHLAQIGVIEVGLDTPPGSPSDGDRYIIGGSPTGAWAGQADKLTALEDGAWRFYSPFEGLQVWASDDNITYVYDGTDWVLTGNGMNAGQVVQSLVIASGAITIARKGQVFVTNEAAAATDDLDTINGGVDGDIIVMRAPDGAQIPTVKHATGNLYLAGANDWPMANYRDTITLMKAGSEWLELSRSYNR